MDRYYAFRKLMDLVAEGYKITDADMSNYMGDMEIAGVKANQKITVTVRFEEVQQDD